MEKSSCGPEFTSDDEAIAKGYGRDLMQEIKKDSEKNCRGLILYNLR
jgi:hypothetical protein